MIKIITILFVFFCCGLCFAQDYSPFFCSGAICAQTSFDCRQYVQDRNDEGYSRPPCRRLHYAYGFSFTPDDTLSTQTWYYSTNYQCLVARQSVQEDNRLHIGIRRRNITPCYIYENTL